MSYDRLLAQSCTAYHVTNTGSRDGMGDPSEVTTTATYRCLLQQSSRTEETRNEQSEMASWNLYLEPDAEVLRAGDRVVIDDVSYEVFGPPWPTFNPRVGAVTHVEAYVRRTV